MAKNWKKAHDTLATENAKLVSVNNDLTRDLAFVKKERDTIDEMFERALDALNGAAESLYGHQKPASARVLEDLAVDLRRRATI